MQWIATVLRRAGFHAEDEPSCLVRLTKAGVQMELLEHPPQGGRGGYRVDLALPAPEPFTWERTASLPAERLDAAIELLTRARSCVQNLDGVA
jgi:hypothetical protein